MFSVYSVSMILKPHKGVNFNTINKHVWTIFFTIIYTVHCETGSVLVLRKSTVVTLVCESETVENH
jgi:hypothetical protein